MNPWAYKVFSLYLNIKVLAPFIVLRLSVVHIVVSSVIFTTCIIIKMCGGRSRYIFIYLYIVECLLFCLVKKNVKHKIAMGDATFHTHQSISVET